MNSSTCKYVEINGVKQMTQRHESLNNFITSINTNGLKVNKHVHNDKRIKEECFFITLNGTSISPILNYINTNSFLIGFINYKKYVI